MPKPFAILIVALLTLYFVPLGALSSSANSSGNETFGGFEMDGNLYDGFENLPPRTSAAGVDWVDVLSAPTITDVVGSTDPSVFTQGSHEGDAPSSWEAAAPSASGKADIGQVYVYSATPSAGADQYAFFAWERATEQNLNGTTNFFLELNQLPNLSKTSNNLTLSYPNRSKDDLRIWFTQQGNSAFSVAKVQVWDPSESGTDKWVDLSPAKQLLVASAVKIRVNDSATTEGPWGSDIDIDGNLPVDQFIEVGINLTALGLNQCPVTGFQALNLRSNAGGYNSQLKDYATGPISIPSNCATLVIDKFGPDGRSRLGGATFEISPNPIPAGTPDRPSTNTITIFDDSADDSAAADRTEGSTNWDDPDARAGYITLPAVVPNVSYTVRELSAPDGYIFSTDWKATSPALAAPYGTVAVSFTNTLGSVKFHKTYQGGLSSQTGATFRLTRDSDKDGQFDDEPVGEQTTVVDNGTNDANSTMGVIKVNNLKTGAYQLAETDAPTGYAKDTDVVLFSIPGANNSADVELANPTFDNPRKTYSLEVHKLGVVPNQADVNVSGAEFKLWRDTNGVPGLQQATDTYAGTCTTGAGGTCTVAAQPWGFDYYWEEISVPAPWNLPNVTVQGPVFLSANGTTNPPGATTFSDPRSKIVTQATNGNLPNATISDTAKVTGVNNSNTGSVTFYWYGPFDSSAIGASTCGYEGSDYATGPNYRGSVTDSSGDKNQSGDWVYESGARSVTGSGYYAWIAVYNGDDNGNRAVAGQCGDANETSYVPPLTPGITTVAKADDDQLPSADLYDTAKVFPVTGNLDTTGTAADGSDFANVDFYLYGPDDATCSRTAVFTSLNRTVTLVSADGGYYATASSAHFQPTLAGTYRWVAHFDGDRNNADADSPCNAENESTVVKKAVPSITTEAGPDTKLGIGGAVLRDSATLLGGTTDPKITGTIVFRLYFSAAGPLGPRDCADSTYVAGSQSTTTVANGNGTYLSAPVTVTKAGWYNWTADYQPGSDTNNSDIGVHGCGLDSETVKVNPAEPTIITTAGADQVIGASGASLTDVAQLAGGSTPTGTITFKLYGPFTADPAGEAGSCVDTGELKTLVGTVTKSVSGNGSYTSPEVTVTKTGYYVWVATYGGDADNASATHPCGDASEVVKVTPRQPVITTDVPGPNVLTLGAQGVSFTDTATLTQATADAKGSISFQLYGPFTAPPTSTSCTEDKKLGLPVGTTSPVSGNGTYSSAQKTVTAAGFYTWVATYSGDLNNNSATHPCGEAEETVEVTKAPTSITTEVADATLELDPTASLVDRATLSGATVAPAATGTITFTLYGPFAADPTGDGGETSLCVAGNVAGSTTTTVSGPKTYTSDPVTVAEAGWYVWVASYSGDANNAPSTHACGVAKEVTKVDKADPEIRTQVPQASVRLAPTAGLTDVATLSDGTVDPAISGTITFTLYGPFTSAPSEDSCAAGKALGTRRVQVNGNKSYASGAPITVSVTGFYTWVARYSGDDNNSSVSHKCGMASETVEVLRTRGTITTDAVDVVKLSSGTTTITDTAVLAGVTTDPAATGTITFRVYGPFAAAEDINGESCDVQTRHATVEATQAVNGPKTYTSAPVEVTRAGYYVWVATYSGDANNASATHPCGQTEETTRVDKASPTISTQVPAASVNLPDASLADTATLSGATGDPAATGTITFRLYGPFTTQPGTQSCSGTPVATFVVDVTRGNGSYTSPTAVVTKAGYYTWVASYSGDANNDAATHACGLASETVLVNKAPTNVTTMATGAAIIKLGQTISDAASVTGLTDDAAGSVTFALFGPDNATCTGTPVFTSTVSLLVSVTASGASGAATSAPFTPTLPGTYRWIASYSGDGNNAVSAGRCNDPNEQSVVRAGDKPNLDKFSDPASGSTVQPGSTINYSVKVFNTGDVAITNADVVDILPPHVTVTESTISDGGVLSADKTRITWKVTLAPSDANSTADEKTFSYSVTVNTNAPEGAVLVNTARFLGLEDTTTHVVPTGDLTILKAVSPVAGNGVVVEFGDTLTYTLTVTATGTLNQTNVVVTDYLPGLDPARPTSGSTTYVAGSAACVGTGTCTVTQPGADGLITWSLGSMAAGSSRQVTFQVTIDDVDGAETVAVDILNAAAVQSTETPKIGSNEVVTPVTKVLPVKVGNPPSEEPKVLPRTGSAAPIGVLLSTAVLLLGLGLTLVAAARRRGGRPRS